MSRLLRYQLRQIKFLLARWVDLKKPAWKSVLAAKTGPECYLYFSKGMRKIKQLSAFVDHEMLYVPIGSCAEAVLHILGSRAKGVVVWGMKEVLPKLTFVECWRNQQKTKSKLGALRALLRAFTAYCKRKKAVKTITFALNFARQHHLPILRMEDGFLRSLDLGVHGAQPLSLVVDSCGMYYDATRASALEQLLNSDWENPDLEESRRAMHTIVRSVLSKYNHAPLMEDLAAKSTLFDKRTKKILVLDQTLGDVSIKLGLADAKSFEKMLNTALAENQGATIYLKVHPDVLSQAKFGHFDPNRLPEGVQPIAFDVAPISLLKLVDEVYTVTSQMGFEALLLGKRVHCFGMPFYAGWGLTVDHVCCPRRKKIRRIEDIFYAAYIQYCRYVHPVQNKRVSIWEIMDILAVQRKVNDQNRGYHACLGFKKWKHPHARAFLHSTAGEVAFFDSADEALVMAKKKQGRLVVWASKVSDNIAQRAEEFGVGLLRMEDGFLRSVGLGSNFFRPGSLVLDNVGIYYDPNKPSLLEQILLQERSAEELQLASRLRCELVARGISKYNISGQTDLPNLPKEGRIILVPGQVEDDASVRLGGLGIFSNLELLKLVRSKNPNAYVIYKEHPDVVSGNRKGAVPKSEAVKYADSVVRTTPIEKVLPFCHEVHTLTSLTGFEAMLRGIRVITYGGPFYAGWGLTTDLHTFPRRKSLPSLDHLVAGTLLLYPRYYDWESSQIVNCASFVDLLANLRTQAYT
ncbi:MAG: capsular polysaccharide biosynthesis protein [Desulfovibrio sp.]|nr:capsular polysaccharide biosynthesis protein [Desulfovibrio sp.]